MTISCSYCAERAGPEPCVLCARFFCETHRAESSGAIASVFPNFALSGPACGPCERERRVHAWRGLVVVVSITAAVVAIVRERPLLVALIALVAAAWWWVTAPPLRDARRMKATATPRGADDGERDTDTM